MKHPFAISIALFQAVYLSSIFVWYKVFDVTENGYPLEFYSLHSGSSFLFNFYTHFPVFLILFCALVWYLLPRFPLTAFIINSLPILIGVGYGLVFLFMLLTFPDMS